MAGEREQCLAQAHQPRAQDRVVRIGVGFAGIGVGFAGIGERVVALKPRPWSWGKMYHIQWLSLRPRCTSAKAVPR